MLHPRRISRYVFSELSGPVLLGLFLWTFVLLMNAFFLLAEKAVAKGLSWSLVLRMFALEIPKILVLAIPMAVLLGCLIGVGRLSADHEWIAFQSAGLSPWALLRPVAAVGLAGALVSGVLYAYLVPSSNLGSRQLQREVLLASNLGADLRPRVFYDDLVDTVLFVEEIQPRTEGRLQKVLIYRAKPTGNSDELILARTGDLYPSPDGSGRLELDLKDGVLHSYRSDQPESYRVFGFGRYHLQIPLPPHLAALRSDVQPTVQDLSPGALLHELREARKPTGAVGDRVIRRFRIRRTLVELHQRAAIPATCILFAILALPLGVTRARTGKGAGFALSLLVIIVYWVVFTVSRDQAVQGRLPAVLGVWSADMVTAVWAAYALWRHRRAAESGRGPVRAVADFFLSGIRALLRLAVRRSNLRSPSGDDAAGGPDGFDPLQGATSTRVVGLVDAYLGKHYLRMLGLALLSVYVVYGIVELKGLVDGLVQNHQPFSLVLTYFKYFAPGMLRLALPIACLIAGVVTITVLSRREELTAMKAVGFSMRRATVPVIVLTLGACALFFFVEDRIAPVTNRKAKQVEDRILGRAPRTYGMTAGGRWTFGAQGRLYHYRLYDPQEERFQGVSVFRLDRDRLQIRAHLFAARADWDGSAWILRDGWERSFPQEASTVGPFRRFGKMRADDLDPPENFARRERTLLSGNDLPEQMSLAELKTQIRALQNSGYDTARLRVAYFGKTAQPLTPLVMVLLGLPFAFRVGRRGSLYAVGVALLLVIVYWATFAIFNALGLETILPPFLAAWTPNILYGLLAVYLMLYIRS